MKIIKKNNFHGLIDANGKVLLPTVYHAVFKISDFILGFRMGIRYGIIKNTGEVVIPAVLDAVIEREVLTCEYEKYLQQGNQPMDIENPFIHKFNGVNTIKNFDTLFIEETFDGSKGAPYIIAKDNTGKIFLCDKKGIVLLQKRVDDLWQVNNNDTFVIFIDRLANIWNCNTGRYALPAFIPANSFYQDPFGKMFVDYGDKRFTFNQSNGNTEIIK